MAIIRDRLGRELSRFELGLVVIILLTVLSVLLGRIEALLASVEQARLEASLRNLNTNVQLEVAARLMSGATQDIADLEGLNPVEFSVKRRGNGGSKAGSKTGRYKVTGYLGELDDPDPTTVPGGAWYFDTAVGALIYQVEYGRYFETTLAGPKRARFRISMEYQDANGNRRFDRGERLDGARLKPLEPYQWHR